MPESTYVFDARTGRYRGNNGRFLSEREVRDAVDRLADLASDKLAGLSERLLDGRLSLADWQRESMAVMKEAHVAAATVAHGGAAQMGHEEWGYVGRRLRDEYAYQRDFARQIAAGEQPLTSGVVARSRLYGQNVRATFEAVRARDDTGRGMDEERNVLGGAEHHCSQCPGLSALGWVPAGTLPPIGSRQCGPNDRCTVTRRHARAQESTTRLLRAV